MAGDTTNSEHRRAIRAESVIVGTGEDETTLTAVIEDFESRIADLEAGSGGGAG